MNEIANLCDGLGADVGRCAADGNGLAHGSSFPLPGIGTGSFPGTLALI
jgi:hypothetical protein